MVLVDTSIWIDHLRSGHAKLTELLNEGKVAIHPFITGELACGNLKNRKEIIALLHALPHIKKADDDEVLLFIEKHKLAGLGIGLIDIHLLASCKLGNAQILTKDKLLLDTAQQLKVHFS